jgi:small-conductance mechanosensitive channel
MAKQTGNVVTYGLSGKIGNLLIFRQVKGKTVISSISGHTQKASEKQTAQRQRFQQAVIYAQAAIASPATGELYQTAAKKDKQPFTMAIADFLNAPDIRQVDLKDYTGSVNDRIAITASDDFEVQTVKVAIYNSDGSLVESGEAVNESGSLWIYTATAQNENTSGDKIVITASDRPGNVTQEEQKLE